MFPAWPQNVTLKKSQQWSQEVCGLDRTVLCSFPHFVTSVFFLILKVYLSYFYVCEHFSCMYIYTYHVHAWCLWRSDEGSGSPGPRDTYDYGPRCGCWKLNPGLLKFRAISAAPHVHLLKLHCPDSVVTDDNVTVHTLEILIAVTVTLCARVAFPTAYEHCCFTVWWLWLTGWREVSHNPCVPKVCHPQFFPSLLSKARTFSQKSRFKRIHF